jgi:hypothetical protein
MAYAADFNGVTVRTSAELLQNLPKGKVIFLAADLFDLSAETQVTIKSSLVAFTRAAVLLPNGLSTQLFPIEGLTFEGVDFTNPGGFIAIAPPPN